MSNFATLQGLSIPEGVVTQITDASGRVIWAVSGGEPVVLQVAKVTSDTYAGETTYTGEQFILLDIYPKTNGTVKVTYGGLTKTITDTSGVAEPNAQQVFFGTFNGVSDSVATPASGELTIEGKYDGFACSSYQTGSKSYNASSCGCITAVNEWGNISQIKPSAFKGCTSLALTELPSGITSIGEYAFNGCTSLALKSLPSGITSIESSAFNNCTSLALTELPSGITSIREYAFYGCTSLALKSLPSGITSIGNSAFYGCTSLALTELPSGITSIGMHTFLGCTSLRSITIPVGVTSIGVSAFEDCTRLHTITIPAGVTSIGDTAFNECDALASITIPASVTSMGRFVFRSCNNLQSATFKSTTGWYVASTKDEDSSTWIAVDVTTPTNNKKLLVDTYLSYYWYHI